MSRIELPDGDAPEIVRAFTLVPEFAKAVGATEKAVWGSSLDWRLHELVRMQVAIINECTVCLGWRTPQAIEAGVTDDDLAAVTDPADPRFSPA
jgi:AhpD family alkylhydroperoxidase